MKKILITTGGTGGHVYQLNYFDHLRIKNKIIFATDLRGYKYLKSEKNDIKIINTPKLNINFLFPFKIVKLLYLIFYSYLILKKENR